MPAPVAVNDTSTFVGNFKYRFAKEFKTLFEQGSPASKRFPFQAGEKLGRSYLQPVDMSSEHGYTAAAAGTTPGVSSAPYILPISGQTQEAQVNAPQIHGRAAVSYVAEMRSADDAQAFVNTNKQTMKRMTQTASQRHEWAIFNGQEGWGQITSASVAGASRVLTMNADTWADGAWIGSIGRPLDFFANSGGLPTGAKLNTGATSTSNAPYITAIDYLARTITVAFPLVGDQALALTSAHIFPESFSATTEMLGLGLIASTTTSYFNIDPATYPEWKGQTTSSVGTLDFSALLRAHGQMAPWFPAAMSTTSWIPTAAYEIVNADQAALRQYDASYGDRGVNGFRSLVFAAQTGKTELFAHSFVKRGRFHITCDEDIVRIGSTEHTFMTNGRGGMGDSVLHSSGSPSKEMRDLIELQVFTPAPRRLFLGTGLTY